MEEYERQQEEQRYTYKPWWVFCSFFYIYDIQNKKILSN
jgi:hypothetical protein